MYNIVIFFLLSEECHYFKLEEPDFSLSKVVCQDIKSCAEVWALYEEFYQGLQEKAKEDWITFRYDFITFFFMDIYVLCGCSTVLS